MAPPFVERDWAAHSVQRPLVWWRQFGNCRSNGLARQDYFWTTDNSPRMCWRRTFSACGLRWAQDL